MSERIEKLMRSAAASSNVTFGTSAPFAIMGCLRAQEIGFASIPVVHLNVWAKDPEDVVTIARQVVYRTLEANGIPCEAVAFTPSVQRGFGKEMFVDQNPSSASKGRRKMGWCCRFSFEIADRSWFLDERGLRVDRRFHLVKGGA
jgi:hypothetical protein